MTKLYKIVSVDYWENDALLRVGNHDFYFQFSGAPDPVTIEHALYFMEHDTYNDTGYRKEDLQRLLKALQSEKLKRLESI